MEFVNPMVLQKDFTYTEHNSPTIAGDFPEERDIALASSRKLQHPWVDMNTSQLEPTQDKMTHSSPWGISTNIRHGNFTGEVSCSPNFHEDSPGPGHGGSSLRPDDSSPKFAFSISSGWSSTFFA